MKNIQNYFLLLFTLLPLLFSSCNKNSILDNDLPEINGNLKLNIVSYYRKPSTLSFEKNYIFNKAFVGIKEIYFKNDKNGNPDFDGSFITDLVRNTTEPTIPYGNLENGIYHQIDVNCSNHLENNQTIQLEGNYHPDGVQIHPFTFSTDLTDYLTITTTEPIQISEDKIHQVSIIFDLAYVFDPINFDSAYQEKDGSINFNDERNAGLHQQIVENLKSCLRIHQLQ